MRKKYSSFEKQQVLTENFRRFVEEVSKDPQDTKGHFPAKPKGKGEADYEDEEESLDEVSAEDFAWPKKKKKKSKPEDPEKTKFDKWAKEDIAGKRKNPKTGKMEPYEESLREEAERTAKGNITQWAREKYATVGKDGFPIFDKKSAIAAIDLRGHASEADQKKILNKAAKFAPKEAKAARERDKEKNEGRVRKNSGKKIVVEISRRKKGRRR